MRQGDFLSGRINERTSFRLDQAIVFRTVQLDGSVYSDGEISAGSLCAFLRLAARSWDTDSALVVRSENATLATIDSVYDAAMFLEDEDRVPVAPQLELLCQMELAS